MFAPTLADLYNRRDYPDENYIRQNEMDQKSEDCDYNPTNLKLVIIISGKRKSGKDHISTCIANYISYNRMKHLAVLRIAGPIKAEFARSNKLNFDRLLDSSDYKEDFRTAMVQWSEEYRKKEGWNCFLKQAIKEQRAKDKAIWILNDARRPCDLEYFDNDSNFSETRIIKLRIESDFEVRMSRGWKYTPGIDDKDTECGLDEYKEWTYVIENNFNDQKDTLLQSLKPIFDEIDQALEGID